jgi:hypothetical protein
MACLGVVAPKTVVRGDDAMEARDSALDDIVRGHHNRLHGWLTLKHFAEDQS